MKILEHINKYLIASIVLILSGCDNYLDVVPKGKIIPENVRDYRLLLDQISPKGKSNGFVQSFSNDLLLSDEIEINSFSASFYNAAEQGVFTFNEHIYQDFESDPDWDALYNQIFVCNLVIAQVMDSSGGDEAEKLSLSAEAKVHRAFAYLILVNLYAKQYDPQSASHDLGVPIRKGLNFEEKLPRKTVQEVYDYILSDLKDAIGHLQSTPKLNLNYRPVESATYGLLARVSLYIGQIATALSYANKSLEIYNQLIDYNTLLPGQSFPGSLAEPVGLQNLEVTLFKSTTTGTSLFYANKELLALYDRDNDLRFRAKFANDNAFGLNSGFLSTGWVGKSPSKGISTAEVFLTRAECYARMGAANQAIADLNHLRKSRFKKGSDYALTVHNVDGALEMVKNERRLELAFAGSRWFDIKRYNILDKNNISVKHEIYGKTYKVNALDPRTVLPIARKYIELNPELEQNPR